MSDRYTVTTFDVCMAGNERLRNRSEFLLVGYVNPDITKTELTEQFMADIQACERPDGFDYDACRATVMAFMADVDMKHALLYVEPAPLGEDGEPPEDYEPCSAYLFINDAQYNDE